MKTKVEGRARVAGGVAGAVTIGVIVVACSAFGRAEEPASGGDAASSGEASADAAMGSFCAAIRTEDLLFCDSFDVNGIDAWNKRDDDPATDLGVDTTTPISPPASARCAIRPGNDDSQDARLDRTVRATSWLEISGVLNIVSADSTQALQFMGLVSSDAVVRARTDGALNFRPKDDDAQAFQTVVKLDPVPVQKSVPFSLRFDRKAKRVTFMIDGQEESGSLSLSGPPGPITVSLGPAEAITNHGWTFLYDDIVVRGGD